LSQHRVATFRKKTVFHVGDLDLGAHGEVLPLSGRRGRESQEFTGLSVSEYPEEWTRIARLGGFATYELRRRDGKSGRFVDMLRLKPEPLLAEAIERGWLKKQVMWKASWEEEVNWDEWEQYESLHETEEEALQQVEGLDGDVVAREVWVATAPLQKIYAGSFSGELGPKASEFAVLLLLEETGSYDGAWWEEELRPEILSAPRGSIFQSKVAEWTAEAV